MLYRLPCIHVCICTDCCTSFHVSLCVCEPICVHIFLYLLEFWFPCIQVFMCTKVYLLMSRFLCILLFFIGSMYPFLVCMCTYWYTQVFMNPCLYVYLLLYSFSYTFKCMCKSFHVSLCVCIVDLLINRFGCIANDMYRQCSTGFNITMCVFVPIGVPVFMYRCVYVYLFVYIFSCIC